MHLTMTDALKFFTDQTMPSGSWHAGLNREIESINSFDAHDDAFLV